MTETQLRNFRRFLKSRREQRDMLKAGYRHHETDWDIIRGNRRGEVILDVKIDASGLGVWTKIGHKND